MSRRFRPSPMVSRISQVSMRGNTLINPSNCVSLAVGEPGFATPKNIVDAQIAALKAGETHYAPQTGHPDLKAAIIHEVTQRYEWHIDERNVLVTHGGSAGLTSAITAVVAPGDQVMIENPTYSLYADAIAMASASPTRFSRTATGEINKEQFTQLARTATAVVLCQPSNPTGRVFTVAEWMFLTKIIVEHNLTVIVDEAYEGLVYDHVAFSSALSRSELRDQLIVSKTFSKKYAMTGWRLGYLVGSPDLITSASVMHRTFNGAVNTATQLAGVAALQTASGDVARMLKEFTIRRQIMADTLATIPELEFTMPDGAFYFWVKYPPELGSSRAMTTHAKNAGVVVRPGEEFGDTGTYCIRLSFAPAVETLREGMERLKSVFNE